MRILVCAFSHYAEHDTNPSETILNRLDCEVEKLLLPCSWKRSKEVLEEAIEAKKPQIVLILNMSPFWQSPTLEQYAHNEMYENTFPDEDGEIRKGEAIYPGEAPSLRVGLDVAQIANVLLQEGHYVSNSIDGGRFFDNEAYYCALRKVPFSLLIHIPLEKDFPLEESLSMVEALIRLAGEEYGD